MSKQTIALLAFVGICFGASAIGGLVTSPEINGWYATLRRPSFAPPGEVYAPVWSLLYFLMGVSAWLVWRIRGIADASTEFALFGTQLILNVLWSVLFFGLHLPGWALVEIALLWLAILATGIRFSQVTRLAGWLLAPYFAWVTFSFVLNWGFWQLNG